MSRSEHPQPQGQARHRSLLLLGQDRRGNWVVRDKSGACGGLFIDRKAAIRFAIYEADGAPRAVVMVPDILELDINALSEPSVDRVATPGPA